MTLKYTCFIAFHSCTTMYDNYIESGYQNLPFPDLWKMAPKAVLCQYDEIRQNNFCARFVKSLQAPWDSTNINRRIYSFSQKGEGKTAEVPSTAHQGIEVWMVTWGAKHMGFQRCPGRLPGGVEGSCPQAPPNSFFLLLDTPSAFLCCQQGDDEQEGTTLNLKDGI